MLSRAGCLLTQMQMRGKAARLMAAVGVVAGVAWGAMPAQARWEFVELQQAERVVAANGTTSRHRDPDPGSPTTQIDEVRHWKDETYPLTDSSKTTFKPLWVPSFGFSGYPGVAGVGAWAEVKGDVRAVLRWVRQGDTPELQAADNPPPVVWLKISVRGAAAAASDIMGMNRMPAKEFVTVSVTGATVTDNSNGTQKGLQAVGSYLLPVKVTGQDEARVVSSPIHIEAKGAIAGSRTFTNSYGSQQSLNGNVIVDANATATVDTRQVTISSDLETKYRFPQPYLNQNLPNNKTYLGFLKRHYTMTAIGEPLASFIGGVARYELSAKKDDGTDIFDNQQYAWTASGSHQSIYVDPAASGDTWKEQDIAVSHPRKHLHLNFGNDWSDVVNTDGYTTSEIRAVATGDNSDLTSVEGTATVHWFSPKLLELAGAEPPDYEPADQAIEDYMIARRQAIEQGAKMTATAFSFYGMAAEGMMPNPAMGVLKGLKFCGQSLRSARNAGYGSALSAMLKSQLVKQLDYSTVQGARVLDDVPEAAEIATRMQARNVKALDAASYTGSAPSQQNLDDIAQLVDGDTVAKQRIENLFADADQSRRRPGEVAQALSVEKKRGITLRRIDAADKAAGKDGDFIDIASQKTYDPVGRYDDPTYDNQKFNFETSFRTPFETHVGKNVDVVVVDTTGLTESQAADAINYAKSYPLPPGKELEFLPLPAAP